jgi:hypothetical protein
MLIGYHTSDYWLIKYLFIVIIVMTNAVFIYEIKIFHANANII